MENDLKDILASMAGDGEAYRRLVKAYEQQIGRLMWRFTRDKGECDTLVQDVFVEAFFSLKSYKSKGPFLHWLNKIATRVGYRFWKQQEKSRLFVEVEDFDAFDVKDCSQEQIDPTEAAAALHKLLAKMAAEDRLVLTLMYFEDCSIEEIAQRMGWTGLVRKCGR
jgi:RNA polymerase sigma-70 factor (ECF subfamily)